MYIYLKFGTEEHMNAMFKKGTIYCNNIGFFANKHDGCVYDENELVTDMIYIEKGRVKIENDIDGSGLTMDVENFHFKKRLNKPVDNIFCLFALDLKTPPEGHVFQFDERLKGFGSHVIIITQADEFARRVVKAIKAENLEFVDKKVNYVDFSRYSGKKTLFMKDSEFEYQNEWRILLRTGSSQPKELSIGSMEDIAILTSSDMNKHRMRKASKPVGQV